jgi:hypothetical protein
LERPLGTAARADWLGRETARGVQGAEVPPENVGQSRALRRGECELGVEEDRAEQPGKLLAVSLGKADLLLGYADVERRLADARDAVALVVPHAQEHLRVERCLVVHRRKLFTNPVEVTRTEVEHPEQCLGRFDVERLTELNHASARLLLDGVQLVRLGVAEVELAPPDAWVIRSLSGECAARFAVLPSCSAKSHVVALLWRMGHGLPPGIADLSPSDRARYSNRSVYSSDNRAGGRIVRRWQYLEDNPAVSDRGWFPPAEDCAELADLREQHQRLLDSFAEALQSAGELRRLAEANEASRSEVLLGAILSGSSADEAALPQREVTGDELADAQLRVEVARDALQVFGKHAVEVVSERADELRAGIAEQLQESEAKRLEARRLLDEADRLAAEPMRLQYWIDRATGESVLGLFPFESMGSPMRPPVPAIFDEIAGLPPTTVIEVGSDDVSFDLEVMSNG